MISSLAERLSSTVAPDSASASEGGAGTQRSSQISTPTTRSGISLQAKSWRAHRRTRWPQSSTSSSTPSPGAKWRSS